MRVRHWVRHAWSVLALSLAVVVALVAPCERLGAQVRPDVSERWPVKSREHVDLWLHGFAMLDTDSSPVPLFRRDYRDSLVARRAVANAVTDLDANRDVLAARLRANPALVNAQFLALYFASWTELDAALDAFVKANGTARGQQQDPAIALVAGVFPTAADRDFARRLLNALRDERERFFHTWWVAETRRRDPALAAVDSLWQREVRPRLQPFLDRTQQKNGDLILSLPLGGEGRTIGGARGAYAVPFPATPDRAWEAIYTAVHEAVGPLVAPAVDDNTTPAEKRSGAADRITAFAQVRGGLLLLERVAPGQKDGYMRFYLDGSGVKWNGDAATAFAAAFPAPAGVLESIARQIAVSFSGI
jgi:hypothetical protein